MFKQQKKISKKRSKEMKEEKKSVTYQLQIFC